MMTKERKPIRFSVYVFIALCTPLTLRAETLKQALQSAIDRAPSIKYAVSQINSADSDIGKERAPWLPNIQLSAGNRVTGGDNDNGNDQYAVSVQQQIYDFGKTSDRIDSAEFKKQVEIWNAVNNAEELLGKVAETYLSIVKGKQNISNLNAEMKEHQRIYNLASARAAGGVDSLGDVRQVEVRIKGLEAEQANALAELNASEAQYLVLVGKMPRGLTMPELNIPVARLMEGIKDKIAHSPRVISLLMEQNSAAAEYSYARKSWMPQLSVSVTQGKVSVGSNDDTMVMFNVTSNLFDGGSSYYEAEGSAQRVQSARWNLAKQTEDSASEIAQLYQEALGYKREAGIYKNREIHSRQVMELYNEQYRVNRRSVLDLLNSAQEFFQTIDSQIQADYNYAVTLLRAVSRLGMMRETFNIDVAGVTPDRSIQVADNKDAEQTFTNIEDSHLLNDNITDTLQPTVRSPIVKPTPPDNYIANPLETILH